MAQLPPMAEESRQGPDCLLHAIRWVRGRWERDDVHAVGAGMPGGGEVYGAGGF